ncbi:MAG: nitrogen assimilation response regulator NtrX [Planktomarina sp.]
MRDILIVDDENDIRELVSDILQDEGFETRSVGNSTAALAALQDNEPALMILDIWLKDSDMDGIDILKHVKKAHPSVPVIIISGHGNIEIAVAAIKQGAYDYVEKPFNIDQLLVVVHRAMEAAKLRHENQSLKEKSNELAPMIGQSVAFRSFKSQLDKVTGSNGRVMLTGAAGTGKELAARYIHANSNRSSAPFLCVNCASLEPHNVENVLYGTFSEGKVSPGLFKQCDGGVIFLDEISELPIETQSHLLRVLADQKYLIPGTAQTEEIDVRFISASTRNLHQEVENGRLREDLFHRLNVVPISVPSLDERREDIVHLAEHILQSLHDTQGLPRKALSRDAQKMLQSMPWPGNIRQLRNHMERVLILGGDTPIIEEEDLPATEAKPDSVDGQIVLSGAVANLTLKEARELFEREYLLSQINRFGGNVSRTASFIGMERSALHRKLKSLGVITSGRMATRAAKMEGTQSA